MRSIVQSRIIALLVVFMLCVLSFGTLAAQAASNAGSPTILPGVIGGSAYAGYLNVPAGFKLVSVGPLFGVSLGSCDTQAKREQSTAAAMKLRGFASSGSLTDSVQSTQTSTTTTVQASSDVQNVNVLAGLITADEVKTVVVSQVTSSSATSVNNSVFTNLVVAGVHISGTPAPNTVIPLPGLGEVILNKQVGPVNHTNYTSIAVTGIDVKVTLHNTYGLPVGTHMLVAHAQSGFTRTSIPDVVSARAYGLFAFGKVGSGFVASGPWANAAIACSGGSSTVSVSKINIPVIGSSGTVTDKAVGVITSSGANAHSSSKVQQLNLLSGTITADVITASSKAQYTSTGSASGTTTLVNAYVAGVLLSANPAPNTRIDIANLGYVIVNEQKSSISSSGAAITVVAFDLHVTMANSFGLPIGVRIIIAHSESNAQADKA